MRKLINFLVISSLFISSTAFALSLNEAKTKGMVGETMQGYVAAVVSNREVEALIKDVNQKRRQKYQLLAKKNNITLQQVEKLAAKKAYDKTARGNYVMKNGTWVKK